MRSHHWEHNIRFSLSAAQVNARHKQLHFQVSQALNTHLNLGGLLNLPAIVHICDLGVAKQHSDDIPMKVNNSPMKVNNIPMEVNNIPMKVNNIPMKVNNIPMEVNNILMEVNSILNEVNICALGVC